MSLDDGGGGSGIFDKGHYQNSQQKIAWQAMNGRKPTDFRALQFFSSTIRSISTQDVSLSSKTKSTAKPLMPASQSSRALVGWTGEWVDRGAFGTCHESSGPLAGI